MTRVKVSDNIALFWKDGQLVCDSFVAHEQRALSPKAEPLLRHFSSWRDLNSLEDCGLEGGDLASAKAVVRQLLDAGILIPEGSDAHRLEDKLAAWDESRRAARYYHCSSRTLENTEFLPLEQDGERLREKARHHPAPPIYKDYPDAERVDLPKPVRHMAGGSDRGGFLDVLLRRRTSRSFEQGRPISLEQLSNILYYVAGATHIGHGAGAGDVLLKVSASGGARHPIEVYPCILDVKGLEPGFYHYSVRSHELELLVEADLRGLVPRMCGDQDWTDQASAVFFYTARVGRIMWKYQSPRAYRVMFIDLGHVSQTFYLTSAWLGLGAFFVGALREETVEKALGLDWTEEIVLGANGVGYARSEARAAGPLRPHP
jgi:SagB-type dehydrogenase family enzyme